MDALSEKLSTITLSSGSDALDVSQRQVKLVYVDIMNFSGAFFKRGNHWSFKSAQKKVKAFVQYANNSNLKLKIFIDAFNESDEAIMKWKHRREVEVRKGERNMPQGMNTLLGDMFRSCGVEVCYSSEADNDDTLASHAHHDGASVLSQDRDFLRYKGRTYYIYTDAKMDHKCKRLRLIPRRDMACHSSRREVISPPPGTKPKDPGFVSLPDYLRGTPSPLTHHFTNVHITVRPLRQAYYAHLAIESNVCEEFPVYSDSEPTKVRWDVSKVPKDSALLHLLKDPKNAYKHFFGNMTRPEGVSSKDWNNHVYATYAVVLELCSLYMGVPLYDLLVKHAVQPA